MGGPQRRLILALGLVAFVRRVAAGLVRGTGALLDVRPLAVSRAARRSAAAWAVAWRSSRVWNIGGFHPSFTMRAASAAYTAPPAATPTSIPQLKPPPMTEKSPMATTAYSANGVSTFFHGTLRLASHAMARTVLGVRVGVMTGGGDCPGLNAVIRAIVRKGETRYDDDILGFVDAWDGVMGRVTMPLDVRSLRGMLPRGGTLLGTRRGSPFDRADGLALVKATFEEMALDGLIVIGGNGSLTVSHLLWEQFGLPIVGVPKTIDNDIEGTQVTFGFHTAVQIATDAIDRLHTTAESHDRVMVVEVMGRHAGWIATYAGIAGGATVILIPEQPFDIDEVCTILKRRHERGRFASIVVVAEGARPAEGTMAQPEYGVDRHGHARLGG